MDIFGPFSIVLAQKRFLLIAINYFIKWVEAEALIYITEIKACDFVWKSIICRFGLSRVIVTDNKWQFDNAKFANFCRNLGIAYRLTSIRHPQSNSKAEVTNQILLQGLKTRLDQEKGWWTEKIHDVLWANRITHWIPTIETPFKLVFGTKAAIPLEIGLPSYRVEKLDEEDSSNLRANLDSQRK